MNDKAIRLDEKKEKKLW